MEITVELLEDKRTIVTTYPERLNWEKDVQAALKKLLDLMPEVETFPAFQIVDLTAQSGLAFHEMLRALGTIARSPEGQALTMYNIQVVYVGSGEMVKFAAESMKQEQYGGMHVPVFETLEEARGFIREQLAVP